MLLQEFNCVEGVQDPPADAAAGDDADERDGDGPRPAAPLPLPPLHKLASQHTQIYLNIGQPEQSGPVLGWSSAIASYGAIIIPGLMRVAVTQRNVGERPTAMSPGRHACARAQIDTHTDRHTG